MKNPLLIFILLLVPFFGTAQPAERACFSVPGGFYEESFNLEIFPFYQQHHIRYTTNGNRPTAESALYTGPLLLDESLYSTSNLYNITVAQFEQMYYPDSVNHCIVIRAAVFDQEEHLISEVATNSYFIRSLGCDTHGLPVVSLCADSLALFDYDTGIMVPGASFDPLNPKWTGNYTFSGPEWERLSNFEFYELDNRGVNQQVGLQTHGTTACLKQQKGLKIYAREEYGKKRLEHKFFENIPNDSFKHLCLKPYACAWNGSGCKDYIANRIASQLNVESLDSRPSVLFLNGEYYGIYYVQEKPDERYLEDHFGVDIEQVNLMTDWNHHYACGSPDNFNALFAWMEEADLSDESQYAYVEERIDISSFIDYIIFEIFSGNLDWPANNVKFWQVGNGKWRWIFFDGDACFETQGFDYFANAVYDGDNTYPSNRNATLFFRKLLENEGFKTQFKQRFSQLLATVFSYQQTKPFFNTIKATLYNEVPGQIARFGSPADMNEWNHYCMYVIDRYLRERPENVIEQLSAFFSVDEKPVAKAVCFPNPSSDLVYLSVVADNFEKCEIFVYDVLCRCVHRQTGSLVPGENIVPLSLNVPPGVYMVKVGDIVLKIVRQ